VDNRVHLIESLWLVLEDCFDIEALAVVGA
jgi:hypothetical protein